MRIRASRAFVTAPHVDLSGIEQIDLTREPLTLRTEDGFFDFIVPRSKVVQERDEETREWKRRPAGDNPAVARASQHQSDEHVPRGLTRRRRSRSHGGI
jgi:hypothetical protein